MAVSISIAITQNNQNIANNTSNVTVKVTAAWTYGSFNRTGDATGSITIDGTKYSFSGIIFNSSQTTTGSQVIMTKTVDVSHNADGSKTLTCSASFVTGTNSGTVTTSGSKALTTIARATTPTVSTSSVDMGGSVTINTPRANSGFTHDLAYSFAGGSYVTIATGVATSYAWTTPDLASKIPSATSGTVTIRCITKSGSTTVGTKTVTMTLKVPISASGLGNTIMNAITKGSKSITFPTPYLGLFTKMPGADGTGGTEASYAEYCRVALNTTGVEGNAIMANAAAETGEGDDAGKQLSATKNQEIIYFPESETAAGGTVVGFGLFSAKTGGTPYLWGELENSVTIAKNAVPLFRIGEFILKMK